MKFTVPSIVRLYHNRFLLALLTVVLAVPTTSAQETDDLQAVLVTGASSGIGLRMTEVLSTNGFYVYAGARKTDDLARLDAMDHVTAVRLDVTIQSEIDDAAELIRAEGRGLFGLINNAGVSVLGPMIEMSDADMHFQLSTNLVGPFRVTKAFADLIIESGGRIMTTGSIAGILSGPMSGAYSMSKHGVEAYVDALAAEMAQFDVKVAVVEPGNYKSQILASMKQRMIDNGYSAEGSRYGSMLDMLAGPVDRSQYNEPDDVAMAALDFLTSDNPKRRYMVVPNQFEAAITIQQIILELVQLNEDQSFTYSRDELVEILDKTLEKARPTSTKSSPSTPGIGIHQAAVEGNLEVIQQLIKSGADLDEQDPMGGSTPLLIAAMFGHSDMVKALIKGGAEINAINSDGSTALLTAALFCRTEIVEVLLKAGADKTLANNAGSIALDTVSGSFEEVRGIYDYFSTVLGPLGLELDYERIEATRPKIAALLR